MSFLDWVHEQVACGIDERDGTDFIHAVEGEENKERKGNQNSVCKTKSTRGGGVEGEESTVGEGEGTEGRRKGEEIEKVQT